MSDMMMFPKTVDEFMEKYKIVDSDEVYTNGAELVPIFRMKQWFEHVDTDLVKHGHWNNHEVACLIADLFGDSCACNFNGIDEWLPTYCDFSLTCCPHPDGVACWEQYLKHLNKRHDEVAE